MEGNSVRHLEWAEILILSIKAGRGGGGGRGVQGGGWWRVKEYYKEGVERGEEGVE